MDGVRNHSVPVKAKGILGQKPENPCEARGRKSDGSYEAKNPQEGGGLPEFKLLWGSKIILGLDAKCTSMRTGLDEGCKD